LPDQDYLNVDETGTNRTANGSGFGAFRAELYTLFKIDPTRSGDVLIEVLGTEFDGVLGCDYFWPTGVTIAIGVVLQFCWLT